SWASRRRRPPAGGSSPDFGSTPNSRAKKSSRPGESVRPVFSHWWVTPLRARSPTMTEMSPAEAILFAAAALPTSERASYLAQVCAGRDDLRQRVERMLAAQPAVGSFLEPPARAGDGTSAHVPDGQPATEDHGDPTARIGSILGGKYKLIEAIGEGGMGSV